MPLLIPHDVKIYLSLTATDMRKSIDGLSLLVVSAMQIELSSGYLFLFRNKSGNKLKALYWERGCFTLWY